MASRAFYPTVMIVAAVALACALVALLAFSEHKAKAAFPGKNGKIAFDRSHYDFDVRKHDVFVINPDGSGLQDVTDGPRTTKTSETEPSFSADGKKIVYVRKPSDSQDREIVTINLVGGHHKTTITDSYFYFPGPSFSPDGKKIVFVKREPDRGRFYDTYIYTVNVDGSGLKQLTNGDGFVGSPSYSPDGKKIVYSQLGNDNYRIWTMNTDGTNKKNLAAGAGPDWSPDGQEIAFSRSTPEPYSADIFAMRPDGTGLRNITRTPKITEYAPAYSPDGNRIAFLRYRSETGGYADIWKVPASGGASVQVTDTPDIDEENPDWGPMPTTTMRTK